MTKLPLRFHVERPHGARATGRLPFAESAALHALVTDALDRSRIQGTAGGPSQNPCALQPDTLGFLGALMEQIGPRHIVEFGSGESTTFFARWASEHGARLVSIEHDRHWVDTVGGRLPAATRASVELRHAPLRPCRRGWRMFLTYRGLGALAPSLAAADFVLNDGPHISGRELVLHAALAAARPGTVIVLDDFRHYAVKEMLLGVAPEVALCFAGEAIDDNSHGLYVLRCLDPAPPFVVPGLGLPAALRSYWRCWRDWRHYGTGD